MKPTACLALLLFAACPAPDPPPITATVALAATPSATAADPFAPVEAKLTFSTGACDLDLTSVDGSLALDPPPPTATRVLVEPSKCALVLVVPAGLPPAGAFSAHFTGHLRATDGTAIAPPSPASVAFTVDDAPQGDDVTAPVLLGSWPPEGDDRLGRTTPVRLFFSGRLASAVKLDQPATGATATFDATTRSVVVTPTSPWPAGDVTIALSHLVDLSGREVDAPALHFVRPDSTDVAPPAFTGANTAGAPPEGGPPVVRWAAAQDDTSLPADVRYLVYVGPPGQPLDWSMPAVVTAPGATQLTIALPDGGLDVGVRAQDEAGNVDDNTIVVEAR